MLFAYVCGTEGRGTRLHHRVGYAGHIIHQSTWHTVFGGERWKIWQKWRYSSVLQYNPRFSYARQTLPVWKHNGPALLLLCIYALLLHRSRLRCETGVTRVCLRIALVAAYFDRLYCFKSDADWYAQIVHNLMRSADGAPMLLQLSIH